MNHVDGNETAESLLDAIGAARGERDRERLFDRLVARYPADRIAEAIRPRLNDLDRPEGEAILRLVESLGRSDLLDGLEQHLRDQHDLSPDRAWLALAILDASGRLEDPDLAAWWDDLADLADDDGSIDDLAGQIEGDPEQIRVALGAMDAIEPEIRIEIIAGLGQREIGRGVAEFLRLLGYSSESVVREAALAALDHEAGRYEAVDRAWADLAAGHPDPEVVERAIRRSGVDFAAGAGRHLATRGGPRILRSLVTAIGGDGQGEIALLSEDADGLATVVFRCDVLAGIVDVAGLDGRDPEGLSVPFDDLTRRSGRPTVEGAHELALGLLSGGLLLGRGGTSPVLRYWLERAVGRAFRPRPFNGLLTDRDPSTFPFESVGPASAVILANCPDWLDNSPLTVDLAEANACRGGETPEPIQDAGAYRFLFEHRLRDRLELYRRMLFWMASWWAASGQAGRGEAAQAIAWQLSDPAHAVPGHPFTVELTTRSLSAAIKRLPVTPSATSD